MSPRRKPAARIAAQSAASSMASPVLWMSRPAPSTVLQAARPIPMKSNVIAAKSLVMIEPRCERNPSGSTNSDITAGKTKSSIAQRLKIAASTGCIARPGAGSAERRVSIHVPIRPPLSPGRHVLSCRARHVPRRQVRQENHLSVAASRCRRVRGLRCPSRFRCRGWKEPWGS